MAKPAKCISIEDARKQQQEWMKTRGKAIESGKFKDVRDFWYSLDELQEYLDYVREKSKEQGVEKPGMRFFLGAYSPGRNDGNATMFLAPTREKDPSKDTEEIEDPNNYEIEPYNTIGMGWPPSDY